jgi:hypothetical protein
LIGVALADAASTNAIAMMISIPAYSSLEADFLLRTLPPFSLIVALLMAGLA